MRQRELLSSLVGAQGLHQYLFAADDRANPTVIVIGTLHKATSNFTEVDLVRVLKRVTPAAILFEVDSSFFDREGRLHLTGDSLEGDAVKTFQRTSHVAVLPYDIERRNQIYAAFHYFEIEKQFFETINKLYREDRFGPEAKVLYQQVMSDLRVRDVFGRGRLELFNSVNCDSAVERKQERYTSNTKRIIDLTPDLDQFAEYAQFYSEFWELRNNTMVRNVLHHAKEFPGKRVVVLCGFEHRYYLVRHLKAAEATSGIYLREFWELASC
jgi:hypothetical protein